jgi:hypothetical protein
VDAGSNRLAGTHPHKHSRRIQRKVVLKIGVEDDRFDLNLLSKIRQFSAAKAKLLAPIYNANPFGVQLFFRVRFSK